MAGSSVLLGGVVFTHGDEEWKKFGEKFEDAREGAALGLVYSRSYAGAGVQVGVVVYAGD